MPQESPQSRPIDRGIFRESGDGTTVFFPWGLAHRGYRLSSLTAKEKASRVVSFVVSSTIAIGVWIAHILQPLLESDATGVADIAWALAPPVAALSFVFVIYIFWATRFVERLPPSDLTISREERLREAVELVDARKLAWVGILVAGLSGLVIWLQPRAWWLGLVGIALGVGLLRWSVLLSHAADDPSN